MDKRISAPAPAQLRAPEMLGEIDAGAAARLLTAAGDVTLVLDADGTVLDVAFAGVDAAAAANIGAWRDRRWVDTVTEESRHKIEEMLRDARGASGGPRWREVNHPALNGSVLPIRYVAMPAGGSGRVVAIGRDLSALAGLQQRLISAQQKMEQDYARLRQAESRYRMLFQLASEAVVILDAQRRVMEINPAAETLLGGHGGVVGQSFMRLLARDSVEDAQAFFAGLELSGQGGAIEVRLKAAGRPAVWLSASPFRQDWGLHLLVRLSALRPAQQDPEAESQRVLVDVLERMPDAFVVADADLRILAANGAFLELTQSLTLNALRGRPLESFLGRPGVDLNVLVGNVRQFGSVRSFSTILRNQFDGMEDVEVSAVAANQNEALRYGFSIRVDRRRVVNGGPGRELPRSVEQLTDLVGRVSLREIVRETADIIERLCIEAALELSRNNRASAAEILGLSRQSLYSKLHRYGLVDGGADGAEV